MRKLWMALVAVVALSIGAAWAEGENGKADKAGGDGAACCCCAKSCPK